MVGAGADRGCSRSMLARTFVRSLSRPAKKASFQAACTATTIAMAHAAIPNLAMAQESGSSPSARLTKVDERNLNLNYSGGEEEEEDDVGPGSR